MSVKIGLESSEDDVNPSECLMFNYQPREGVPGFDIETKMNCFGHLLLTGYGNASKHHPPASFVLL